MRNAWYTDLFVEDQQSARLNANQGPEDTLNSYDNSRNMGLPKKPGQISYMQYQNW